MRFGRCSSFGLGFALLCCTGLRLPKGRVKLKFQAFFMVLRMLKKRKIMRKKFLLLALPLLLLTSCDKLFNIATNLEEKPFEVVDFEKSNFRKVGDSYQYEFMGTIKNVSDYIFDEVYCSVEVRLYLDNGNVITKRDYNSGILFSDFGSFDKVWKPNEERLIQRTQSNEKPITSDYIPNGYKEYNIDGVQAVLTFKTKDLVNRKDKNYRVRLDITDEWNNLK